MPSFLAGGLRISDKVRVLRVSPIRAYPDLPNPHEKRPLGAVEHDRLAAVQHTWVEKKLQVRAASSFQVSTTVSGFSEIETMPSCASHCAKSG